MLFQNSPPKERGGLGNVPPRPPPKAGGAKMETGMELGVRTEKPCGGRARRKRQQRRAGCTLGWPRPKNLTQRSHFSLILPQDCGRGKKGKGKQVRSLERKELFVLNDYLLGLSPIFWVLFWFKRSFMSPMRVCIFVGFKYSLIRCCLFTERKDAFYFILLCHFNLLLFVFNN